jgi:hypothetical protein
LEAPGAEASPSGLNATTVTQELLLTLVVSGLARVSPSGLNVTEWISPIPVADGVPISTPVDTFQSCIVPSASALARVFPSGLNATEKTPAMVSSVERELIWPELGHRLSALGLGPSGR